MILAPSSEVSAEVSAVALFLGSTELTTVERPIDGLPDRGELDSVLLAPRVGDDWMGWLAACRGRMRASGRIAVLIDNRFHQRLARLRRPGSRRGSAGSASSSLAAVRAALRRAGFAGERVYAVSPSAERPLAMHPWSWSDTWRAPALLVCAAASDSAPPMLLDQAALALERLQHGAAETAAQATRVAHSPREKSIALVQGRTARYVVRIARSTVMDEDESRSYRLLETMQANPRVAALVPRPLGAVTIGPLAFYAQSHLDGMPLSRVLRRSNRGKFLAQAQTFLNCLNPDLANSAPRFCPGPAAAELSRPMIDFALSYVTDHKLRQRAAKLVSEPLASECVRLGIVHGDFGMGNLLVEGERITGVIDWEAARPLGLPVLDAFNYLDSAHRCCEPNQSIVDLLPALAGRAAWPVADEIDFLARTFERCGIDFLHRQACAVLYALFHFGPQLRFADRFPEPIRRMEAALHRVVMQ